MAIIRFKAEVEFGVGGYVHSDQKFQAGVMSDLVEQISKAHIELIEHVEQCAEEDGDLRRFAPPHGDHYIMYDGVEDVSMAVTKLTRIERVEVDATTPDSLNTLHALLESINPYY